MKKKVFLTILFCAICALMTFTLVSCKGKKGETGPEGPQGVQGEDGATWLVGTTNPELELGKNGDMYLNTLTCDIFLKVNGTWEIQGNLKGEAADPNNLAYLVFVDDYGCVIADPMIVEKGQTAQLPELNEYGKEFVAWKHGIKTITSETPIEESMTLLATWKPKLELSLNSYNEYYVGEKIEFSGFVSEEIYRNLKIDTITHNGVTYTESEYDPELNILLDSYMDYNSYIEETEYTGYLILGQVGEYTITFKLGTLTASVSFTIKQPVFTNTMSVDKITFTSDFDNGVYRNNDEVTLYDILNRPKAEIQVVVTAPMLTEFTGTFNDATPEGFEAAYTGDNQWTITIDNGNFDETVTTNVFKVVGTSEYYGTVTGTFTVHLANSPENGEVTLMHNSYSKVIVYDGDGESNADEFYQSVQFYSLDKISVASILKDANGTEITDISMTTNTNGVGQIRGFTNAFSLGAQSVTLTSGLYTVYSTVTDGEGLTILETSATFYVASNWDADEIYYNEYYVGEEFELSYELNDVLTGIKLGGVELSTEEFKQVTYENIEFSAKFYVEGSKTILTIKGVGYENESYYTESWFNCVVTKDTYSYDTYILQPHFEDPEKARFLFEMELPFYLYTLEKYFAEEIKVEDSNYKKLYDYINVDTSKMTLTELKAYFENPEVEQLFDDLMLEMEELPLEGKPFTEYLEAARKLGLEKCYFEYDVIIAIDDTMHISLFDDLEWNIENPTLADLFWLGTAEASYVINGGKSIADMIYYQMDIEEYLDYIVNQDRDDELIEYFLPIVEAKHAVEDAIKTSSPDVDTLIKVYCEAMNNLLIMFLINSL